MSSPQNFYSAKKKFYSEKRRFHHGEKKSHRAISISRFTKKGEQEKTILILTVGKTVFTKTTKTLQKFADQKSIHADKETAPPLFLSAIQPDEATQKARKSKHNSLSSHTISPSSQAISSSSFFISSQ